MSDKKNPVSTDVQYDERVKRKSHEDPSRHHRRSSIPFVDRTPAVRFIRLIEQRKASVAGPNQPSGDDPSKKPILKKTDFPILVNKDGPTSAGQMTVNDELENCRNTTDMIMERISRAERIARGSMDVLTFPTATRRVEAMSRYQGCMTICVCSLDILTNSKDFTVEKKKGSEVVSDLQSVIDTAHDMIRQADALQNTAKKFLSRSKKRYNEWEGLVKQSADFKIDHMKMKYPIYTTRRMPESVTMYEDALEDRQSCGFDGLVRISRKYPEEIITLHIDSCETMDLIDPVNFQESSLETQVEAAKLLTTHGRDLLIYSDNCLCQGLEVLFDDELDEAFGALHKKIGHFEYDDNFDPLCALELKNALGELVARKAELLNTAERIVDHCKQLSSFSRRFHRYAKKCITGSSGGLVCCLGGGSSKKSLLNLLGMVTADDTTILLPLTLAIAQDIFHMDPFKLIPNNENNQVDNK